MADKLSATQRAYLVLLMAQGREVSNPEIAERYGKSLTLVGENKRALESQRLIETRKAGRSNAFALTDAGWRRAREELSADFAPKAAGAIFAAALHALMNSLGRSLAVNNRALTDIVAPEGKSAADRIRVAYRQLAKQPQDWVSLTDLRASLGDGFERAEVDRALQHMALAREIALVPEENQRQLSDADRAAAIRIGGEDKHLMSIENHE